MRADEPRLPETVAAELHPVRQRLRSHGGDLRIVAITGTGDVEVEFLGACCGCPAVNFTFSAVVVPAIQAIEGTTKVSSKQARYSAFIAERAGLPHSPARTATRTPDPAGNDSS